MLRLGKENAVLTREGTFIMMPAVPIDNPKNPRLVSRLPGSWHGFLDLPTWLTTKSVRGAELFLRLGPRVGFLNKEQRLLLHRVPGPESEAPPKDPPEGSRRAEWQLRRTIRGHNRNIGW